MKKKGNNEFSDTVVVILLVAVILISFIGSLLIYNNVSKTNTDLSANPPVNTENKETTGNGLSSSTGMVAVVVIDEPIESGDEQS